MLPGALGWTVLLATAGLGVGFVLTDGFGLFGGSTVISISDMGCGQSSFEAPTRIPDGAARHDLAVRGGEPFRIPVPEGNGTAVRYEIHADGVGVSFAHEDGTPVRRHPQAWSDLLGACSPLGPDDEADGFGPFVTQRDGAVTAYAWRVAGAGS